MKMSELIALLSCLGALISTIIVMLTLFEMKKQRESSYKPELFVNGSHIEMYWTYFGDVPLANLWKTKKINIVEDLNKVSYSNDGLILHNVGLGPAHLIEIKWSYDIKKMVELVKKEDHKNEFEINLFNDYSFVRLTKDSHNIVFKIDDDNLNYYDFQMPYQDGKENIVLVELPKAYVYFVGVLIYLSWKNDNQPVFSITSNTPKLVLSIGYKDIIGKKYTKEVVTKIDLMSSRKYGKDKKKIQKASSGTISFSSN